MFSCDVSQQDGFVCSNDIIDRGIFSGGNSCLVVMMSKEAFWCQR